jgi:hypothetical protein
MICSLKRVGVLCLWEEEVGKVCTNGNWEGVVRYQKQFFDGNERFLVLPEFCTCKNRVPFAFSEQDNFS